MDKKIIKSEFTKLECLSWIGGTVVLFGFINMIMAFILPKISNYLATHKNFWRFKNTTVSWIHSLLASTLVMINIVNTPAMFEDMINISTKLAYITISVSAGYFIYDAIDIIYTNKKLTNQSIEVLLHHLIIIGIFWVPLLTNQFVGYTLAALSIEFNTIFLHLRFMFVFFNTDKSSGKYRLISIMNIISFVLFRILTLCWMTRWIVLNRKLVHVGWFSLGSFGLAAMMVINILLLQRLLQSDFSREHKLSNNSKETVQNAQTFNEKEKMSKIH